MRVLLLEHETRSADARAALAGAELLLIVRLEEGLGGVWTEFEDGAEVIRLGFPKNSSHAFFRPLDPRRGGETCASVALGRMVYGRRIGDVVCFEPALAPVVAHALKGHHVRCWFGAQPCGPEALGTVPGFSEPEAVLAALAREIPA